MKNIANFNIGDKVIKNYAEYIVIDKDENGFTQFERYDPSVLYKTVYEKLIEREACAYDAIVKWFYIVRENEGWAVSAKKNIDKEINAVKLCIEKDNIDINVFVGMLTYAMEDKMFWRKNLISLAGLRRHGSKQTHGNKSKSPVMKLHTLLSSYESWMSKNSWRKR
jgi:hypothetical protein